MTKRMNMSEKRSAVTSTFTNSGSESTQTLPNEIWKDIPNYEGEYQVSNLGRIKSLSRSYLQSNGKKITIKTRIRKESFDRNGYHTINLKEKIFLVSRLVAEVFIPNMHNFKEVNHINGNKDDNSVSNLEWCDRTYNMRHAFSNGLIDVRKMSETRKGKIKNIDKELISKIKHLLLIGNRIADIAKVLKLSRNTIYNIIHRANIPYSFNDKYNKRYEKNIEKEIIELSKLYNISSISKKLSISRDTIGKYLRKNNVYKKKPNSQILLSESEVSEIIRLRSLGMTFSEISKNINRSASSICKLINGKTKCYKKGGLK